MSFTPGTIVVQYADDDHTVVGVVISSEIGLPKLDIQGKSFNPENHHILLVIGWHSYAHSIPIGTFGHKHVYMPIQPFPHVLSAKIETASECNFDFEIKQAERAEKHYKGIPNHPGLNPWCGKRCDTRFFPPPEEIELLEIVKIVQQWKRSDAEIPMTEYWKNYSRGEGKQFNLIIETLGQLLPRTT